MIFDANNVSHLVALVMHQGVPGGNANIKPVIYEHPDGMHFRLVRADNAADVLGRIATPYRDEVELIAQIVEANRKWGYPTAEMLAEAFPKEGRLRA